MTDDKSYHNYLADWAETLDDSQIESFFVVEESPYITRLMDDQQRLLIGSRGVGKSMLLKKTELTADKEFNTKRNLGVYVTFKSSLILERMQKQDLDFIPFRQWTFAKILISVIDKMVNLNLDSNNDDILKEVYGDISLIKLHQSLVNYVKLLENKNITNTKEVHNEAEKIIFTSLNDKSIKLLELLENPNSTKIFLEGIAEKHNLNQIIFLFDEAAHLLSPEQQGEFFTIFKSLKSNRITCKAAVYPAITNYGNDFNISHDARPLYISRTENDKNYLIFFRNLLEKRFDHSSTLWKKLTKNEEIVNTLCYACSGNPRMLFHLIDIFDLHSGENPSLSTIQAICRKFVQEELWPFHDNNGFKFKSFAKPVALGHEFISGTLIPALSNQNNVWREKESISLSIYCAIPSEIHSQDVKQILDLLAYSGILSFRDERKIGHNSSGRIYALHLAIAIAESVIKNDKRTNSSFLNEIKLLERERFTQSNIKSVILEYADQLTKHSGISCSTCNKSLEQGWKLCPYCGNEISQEKTQYFELLSHPIERLFLSEKLKRRILEHKEKNYEKVEDLLDATLNDLGEISYIGPVRSRAIKGAAEEYISS